MVRKEQLLARAEMVEWVARLGAVTAEVLAEHDRCKVQAARGRLQAAVRSGLLLSSRPLQSRPAIYTATAAGLRAAELERLEPGRVSAANAAHAIACAEVAVTLELAYPDYRVMGERWLRGEESDTPLASATLGWHADGSPLLHRPDLVLWSMSNESVADASLPVAIEVELTVKAPRRLFEICRAWARCRCVDGVIYFAAPEVLRPLGRAIEKANAGDRIVMLDMEAVVSRQRAAEPPAPKPRSTSLP
jgi:hypothetical protein